MEELNSIKHLINDGETDEALKQLDALLEEDAAHQDDIYYLKGNCYRKCGNWQQSLNNYQKAIDINPDHPAKQAYQMVIDILEFYHKDMYNQ